MASTARLEMALADVGGLAGHVALVLADLGQRATIPSAVWSRRK